MPFGEPYSLGQITNLTCKPCNFESTSAFDFGNLIWSDFHFQILSQTDIFTLSFIPKVNKQYTFLKIILKVRATKKFKQ